MKRIKAVRLIKALLKRYIPSSLRKGPALAWTAAFVFCLVVIFANLNSSRSFTESFGDFEAGRVADSDIIAEQTISYEDENATRLRFEAQERLVLAVFNYSRKESEEIKNSWGTFAALAGAGSASETGDENETSAETFALEVQSEFPGDFSEEVLALLYNSPNRGEILKNCTVLLDALLEKGIFSMPQTGLEAYNPDLVELIRETDARIEQERVYKSAVVTRSVLPEYLEAQVSGGNDSLFARIAPLLLMPFLKENVFYSPEDTLLRITELRARTEPVMRTIEQGQRVIKKGFIITEEEMKDLAAMRINLRGSELPIVFSDLLFVTMLFGLLIFFCGRRTVERDLTEREAYLVSGLSALYIAGSVIVKNLSFESMPASVVIPTALVMMLPSILIHSRLAMLLAMSLPLGAFLTGSFNTPSYIFALVSGVVASCSLHGAEKRMDLVKAGLINAAANVLAMTALLLWQRSPAGIYPHALFWAAFNGVACGMLVLGFLPPLEHALNAATAFRLIELSDLNAPILRRLFTAAPGTYSHSIMVANLAEAACQDIGANPLLARVGAYYHDLGKMENPDYFVENQTDHNRHDDLAPRLSATVIRSHVKLGVEKARQLGLPRQVIDIIAEHHGDSVITWFYSKALKQESGDTRKAAVDVEDFTYPGTPPRSRESAVVMLADVTEAAVRTIDKPTAVKIEKFIQELISKKVEHGQLAQSELTFRDLETIKNAFVRVLAGYYHSRIEYPKIDEGKSSEEEHGGDGAAQK